MTKRWCLLALAALGGCGRSGGGDAGARPQTDASAEHAADAKGEVAGADLAAEHVADATAPDASAEHAADAVAPDARSPDGNSDGVADRPATRSVAFTFDTSSQGFVINPYCEPNPAMAFNLAGSCPDGGTAVAPPALSFIASDGNPAPGALRVTATFTGYNQYVDVVVNLPAPVVVPSTGLQAQVKLVSSTGPFPGGGMLHASSGAVLAGSSGALAIGTWTPLALPLDPTVFPGFDTTTVEQIGVEVYSGAPPPVNPTFTPVTVVFEIDSILD